MARRRRRRRRGSSPWRGLLLLIMIAAGVYLGGRALLSLEGRYWVAQQVWRGNPTRVRPVLEEAIEAAAQNLNLPPPYPRLTLIPADSTERSSFETQVMLTPGVSVIQANAGFTQELTGLGLELERGEELADRSIQLHFDVGERSRLQLQLIPATTTGLDTVVTPVPNQPSVDVRARMAIVIEDYGKDGALTRRFDALPGTFTAAVYSEDENARTYADRARSVGMEVLANLPMEPKSFPIANPGPGAILVDMSGRAIRKAVNRGLDRVGPSLGVKTRMGGLAVEDRDVMRAILEELAERKQLFFDGTGEKYSTAAELGRKIGVEVVVLESVGDIERGHRNSGTIEIRFNDFVAGCRRKGYAIGWVSLNPGTLEVLEQQLPALARQGIVVMGLSEVLKAKQVTPPR